MIKKNNMMKEVNPEETTRAYAFEMWMNAPMPMVTFFKTLDVTPLVRASRRKGLKFNMLMGGNTYRAILGFGCDWPYDGKQTWVLSRSIQAATSGQVGIISHDAHL